MLKKIIHFPPLLINNGHGLISGQIADVKINSSVLALVCGWEKAKGLFINRGYSLSPILSTVATALDAALRMPFFSQNVFNWTEDQVLPQLLWRKQWSRNIDISSHLLQ